MERMCASHPVFMRCLKPNQQKQAHLFDDQFVRAQVTYDFTTKKTDFELFQPSFDIVECWRPLAFEKKDILYDYLSKNSCESNYLCVNFVYLIDFLDNRYDLLAKNRSVGSPSTRCRHILEENKFTDWQLG